jgi:hypothetical protein
MTNCQKGHRCRGRRRGHESLISPHLRFTISDGRRRTQDRSGQTMSGQKSKPPAKIKPKSGRFKPKKWQRHLPMLAPPFHQPSAINYQPTCPAARPPGIFFRHALKVMQGNASVFDPSPPGGLLRITVPHHALKVNKGKLRVFDTPRVSPVLSPNPTGL